MSFYKNFQSLPKPRIPEFLLLIPENFLILNTFWEMNFVLSSQCQKIHDAQIFTGRQHSKKGDFSTALHPSSTDYQKNGFSKTGIRRKVKV
jgi:hypothetical protein